MGVQAHQSLQETVTQIYERDFLLSRYDCSFGYSMAPHLPQIHEQVRAIYLFRYFNFRRNTHVRNGYTQSEQGPTDLPQ